MPGQRLYRQRRDDCRLTELQKTLTTSEALQELSARVCKKLLMRRLIAKKGTALLEARDWSEEEMEKAADLKIRCSDRAEENEDIVMSDSIPALSADKKQSEKLQRCSQEAQQQSDIVIRVLKLKNFYS
ncbi:uncharacterized protein BDCG_01301 [Blastomyces dermatitidis ER-3]|uniref:Uncharacterized protein n=1 Tax=Ajellomyces dermatitidis (strain ER-3 / ATCC MYA-2586) TaxID=559297 RepID=A0ABP2EQ81_AJEDR|nr:uncharacterized protein BDCG_01301 [Blastomyces dermatitidis ER-3]EEQ84496.2 hypothetical protein BDCG_01301 [Blastomyces dermatitidis ER-3]